MVKMTTQGRTQDGDGAAAPDWKGTGVRAEIPDGSGFGRASPVMHDFT